LSKILKYSNRAKLSETPDKPKLCETKFIDVEVFQNEIGEKFNQEEKLSNLTL